MHRPIVGELMFDTKAGSPINALNEGGVLERLKETIAVGHYEPVPNVLHIEETRYDGHVRQTICRSTMAHFRRGKARLFRDEFRQRLLA